MPKPKKRGIKFSSSSVTFDVGDVDGLLFEARVPSYRKAPSRKTWRVLVVVDKPLRFDGDAEPSTDEHDGKKDEPNEQVMEHDSAVTLSQLVGHTVQTMNKDGTLLAPKIQVLCAAIPSGPEWERWDVRGRLIALFDSIQPDIVMLAGTQIAYAVAQPPPKRLLAAEYGRLKDYSVDSFSRGRGRKRRDIRAIVTMPLEQLVDPEPPIRGADGGGAVNLISDFCDHLEAALADRNRYELATWVDNRRKRGIVRVDTMPKFKAFMKALKACGRPAIDTESDSLGRKVNTLLCMQFYLPTPDGKRGKGYFLPMQHREATWTGKEYVAVKKELCRYFEDGGSDYIIMHNGKHDIIQFYNSLGARWFGHRLYDTIAGAQVLNENRKHLPKSIISRPYGLDTLEMNYGYVRTGLAVEKEDRSNMADRPLSELEPYGVLDSITTYCIHRVQRAEAKRVGHDGYMPLVIEQVGRTMRSISRMEHQGLRMDVAYLAKMAMSDSPVNRAVEEYTEMFKTSKAARKVNLRLAKKAGWQPSGLYGDVKVPWVFNVRKTEHLSELFLKELSLTPVAYSKKTGEPSLGKAFLGEYKASVPEAEWLSDYSEMFKLKTGFIDTLLRRLLTDPDAIADHHIRSSYSIRDVASGRLGSRDPNLQNIATRSKISALIKRAFIADIGCITLKADFSAHEINMLANVSADTAIMRALEMARASKLALRLAKPGKALEAAIKRFAKEGDLHIINCIDGNSLIPSSMGILRLKDSRLGGSSCTGKEGTARVAAWLDRGMRDTVRVTLRDGRIIRSTSDHRILVLSKTTLKRRWVAAADLKKDDLVCIRTEKVGRSSPLPLSIPPFNPTDGWCSRRGRARDRIITPQRMTPQLAWWLGALVADGAIYVAREARNYVVSFSSTNKLIANEFAGLAQELFGVTFLRRVRHSKLKSIAGNAVRGKLKPLIVMTASSRELHHILGAVGVYIQSGRRNGKVASHYVQVPRTILEADVNSQIAFISAYMDCDGCVTKSDATISSQSLRLLREMQVMLGAHGVYSKISEYSRTCKGLRISGESYGILRSLVDRFEVRKRPRLVNRVKSCETIPVANSIRSFISSRRVGRTKFINDDNKVVDIPGFRDLPSCYEGVAFHSKWSGWEKFKDDLSRISAQFHSNLEDILGCGLNHYSGVASVKPAGSAHVYDLSMSGGESPSFVANGAVVHNCKAIYGLDIDGDHPLRSSVKSAIFGLIYAMGPLSLGLKIIEPELKDLKKKLVELAKREQALGKPKTRAERVEYDKIVTELERISARIIEITDRDHLLKAGRDIIDKVFAAWPMAAKWLDTTRSAAQKALEVTSPTNRKRHMWAYLHSNPKTQAAMDRKGPNAVIQGLASEVACVASDLGGEFEWETFTRNGLPLNKRLGNMVHDSQSSQLPFHLLSVGAYLTEHSMTTFPIKFYRDTFGFELQSPSGIDIEYGFNDQKEKRDKATGKVIESGMKSWKDMRFDTMRTHIEELCDESKANRATRKAALSNLEVIRDLREGELVKDQFKMDKRATRSEWWKKNIVWEVANGR